MLLLMIEVILELELVIKEEIDIGDGFVEIKLIYDVKFGIGKFYIVLLEYKYIMMY